MFSLIILAPVSLDAGSSEDDDATSNILIGADADDDGVFSFKRNKCCQYHKVCYYFTTKLCLILYKYFLIDLICAAPV